MAVILIRTATLGGTYDADGVKRGAQHIRARYASLDEAIAQVEHEGVATAEGEPRFLRIESEETGEVIWEPT